MTDEPSRRAGLHDQLVNALGQIDVIPPVAHRRAQADQVLALLYREWPWLRAAADDLPDPIQAGIDTATRTAVRAIQLMNEAGQERDRLRSLLAEILGQFQPLRHEHDPTGEIDHWQCRVLPYEMDAWQTRAAAAGATDLETTARIFAALHRSAEDTVSRVIALAEVWQDAPDPLARAMGADLASAIRGPQPTQVQERAGGRP